MRERVISIGIFVFALIYLAGSIPLQVGNLAEPGPGFMPAGIAIILLLVSGLHAYQIFRQPSDDKDSTWNKVIPWGIAVVTLIYPLILARIGYLLATFIILVALFRLLKFKTVLVTLLTSFFVSLVSFLLFAKLLSVALPAMFLEEFILRL